jgi:hypothetical protein
MWTTRVYLKSIKTEKQRGSNKIILLFTSPTFITHPSADAKRYQRALRSLWIYWHYSHTFIPWKYKIFVWLLKCSWILESLAFYSIHFIWTIFTHLFNFNLFRLDNFNLIRIKFLSLAADRLSHLCGPQVEKLCSSRCKVLQAERCSKRK